MEIIILKIFSKEFLRKSVILFHDVLNKHVKLIKEMMF